MDSQRTAQQGGDLAVVLQQRGQVQGGDAAGPAGGDRPRRAAGARPVEQEPHGGRTPEKHEFRVVFLLYAQYCCMPNMRNINMLVC